MGGEISLELGKASIPGSLNLNQIIPMQSKKEN